MAKAATPIAGTGSWSPAGLMMVADMYAPFVVYRDVEALSAAGVPIYTEVGRNGGICIDPAYRIAGLPRLDAAEAREVLFAVVPALAEQLGLDAAVVDRTLLPAMERSTETAARVVRDRLLVEPTHWFVPPDATPALAEIVHPLPLPGEVERDERGWARLRLRFERTPAGAARHRLRLGAEVEVLDPPELRELMTQTVAGLAALYDLPNRP